MNWEAAGTIAEVISAFAVVVSLIYLATQIRQNTNATKAGTSFSVNTALTSMNDALRSSAELADIWIRGCQSLESLSEIERIRFTSHMLELLNLTVYIDQLEQQNLSDAHIDYIPWIAVLYRDNPGVRSFVDSMESGWSGSRDLFDRLRDVEGAKGSNVYRSASHTED